MERARHRKTKSASGIEGIRQFQKQNAASRLSSDSRFYISGNTRDDKLMLDLGGSSLRGTGRKPMNKLLAEEMSKEVEPRRRSPNVIARLMGLEGLPSPRHVHVHRQPKRFDNHQNKRIPINIKSNSKVYDAQLKRSRSMEQQEFKDVHEDLDASHAMNRRCSSRWSASAILTKPEMAIIHQKFINAKRFSTDENLQDLKELDDTSEILECNKNLSQKVIRQPDELFSKHLPDVQVDPATALGSRIAVLKPSDSVKSEAKAQAWKLEREISRIYNTDYHQKRKDGLLLESHNHHRTRSSCRSSKIPIEEKNKEKIHTTRIVILKPNLAKTRTVGMSGSSTDRSRIYGWNFEKMTEHSSDVGIEIKSCRRNDTSSRMGLVGPMSKEAREIARNITRRMKDGFGNSFDGKFAVGFRGYAGDESSYDEKEGDIDSDLEVFKLSSEKSSSDNKLFRCSSSSSVESSVSREGKKRLSERWTKTQRYQELEMVRTGGTLGEMLALADRETMIKDFDNKRASSRRNSNPGTAGDDPSAISSNVGWKEETERTSSRSRSKSLGPIIDGRSQRRSTYRDGLPEDKHLVHSNPIHRGRSNVAKEILSHKDDFSANALKSINKKPQPCQHVFINEAVSSAEVNFQNQMKESVKELSEQQPMPQMIAKDEICDGPIHDIMTVSEHGSTKLLPRSSVLLPEHLSSVTDDKRSAARVQEISNLQGSESGSRAAVDRCFSKHQKLSTPQDKESHGGPVVQGSPSLLCVGAEHDSSESSKEADHTSPVSVLGVPFTEETTVSESFGRVSAELHELRVKLQLLKLESNTCAEISPLVSTEEEVVQLSPVVSEGNCKLGGEGWEISYALDLLIDSGLEESCFDMFRTIWFSPYCPLDPKLFNNLEKKYGDATMMSRSERMLLFDSINSCIVEIFEEHVDSCPWVSPKLAWSEPMMQREGVIDAVGKLIKQMFSNEEITEIVLDKEMQWSFSKGEVDVVGMEIEKLLIDEVVEEVFM